MKSLNLFFFPLALIGLNACTAISEDELVQNQFISDKNCPSTHISESQAAEMANMVMYGSLNTRTEIWEIPTCEYVLENNSTRSVAVMDTLAYVFNYPHDKGFVILSSDRRVYPVLAFSNEGHFSFDNEIARDNFISNIGSYLSEAAPGSYYEVSPEEFDGCYVVDPIINFSLNQTSPWDKYVIEEHPGCPAGCVAVATALVMSHSTPVMTYHDIKFNFESIIKALNPSNDDSATSDTNQSVFPWTLEPMFPTYTYEEAVDYMAKLLYWIGKDVNMTYETDGSFANSRKAYDLLNDLGFNIPSGYAGFDIVKITKYLSDNHIIYLRGSNLTGGGGHAWVSDACHYCVNLENENEILDTYIRCDWGWGGYCNGYFSGSVFTAGGRKFRPEHYFAVLIENNNLKQPIY